MKWRNFPKPTGHGGGILHLCRICWRGHGRGLRRRRRRFLGGSSSTTHPLGHRVRRAKNYNSRAGYPGRGAARYGLVNRWSKRRPLGARPWLGPPRRREKPRGAAHAKIQLQGPGRQGSTQAVKDRLATMSRWVAGLADAHGRPKRLLHATWRCAARKGERFGFRGATPRKSGSPRRLGMPTAPARSALARPGVSGLVPAWQRFEHRPDERTRTLAPGLFPLVGRRSRSLFLRVGDTRVKRSFNFMLCPTLIGWEAGRWWSPPPGCHPPPAEESPTRAERRGEVGGVRRDATSWTISGRWPRVLALGKEVGL